MRFEPGDIKTVTLCSIAGRQVIRGGNGIASGKVDLSKRNEITRKFVHDGFSHIPADKGAVPIQRDTIVDRATYVSMFGPTTGDRVTLGDTGLIIEVEEDRVCIAGSIISLVLNSVTELRFPLKDGLWRRMQIRRR